MSFTARTLGLARAAIRAVGAVIDAAVRVLVAAWARAWDTVEPGFTGAVETLTAAGDWPPRRSIDRDPALQAALSDAARALTLLAGLTAAEATRAAQTAAGQATGHVTEQLASQLPPGLDQQVTGAAGGPGGFHQRAIDTIQNRVGQRITALSRPLARDADRAMRRELVRGVKVGDNPRESARRMVARVQGAFNGGLTRALVITRTETLDAYREAARVTQDASRDVLAGWVWLAALDTRSCPACWAMHGTVHPLTEPGPQGHPQCRCTRAPKTQSWRDLGFDLDEPADAIPDAQAVFAALPPDVQARIMGPARLGLLNSGAVQWSDLARRRNNPGWRPSWTPTPVSALVD